MATNPESSEMRVHEAERRLASRLAEIELAAEEGRLVELAEAVPTIDDQLRPYLNGSSVPS